MLPSPAICVSAAMVFLGNVTLQTPDAMPSFTVQLIPAGALVIVPPPRDAGDGRTVSVVGIVAAKPAPMAVVAPDVTMTPQVPPLQAPVNPVKTSAPALIAFNVTATPASKLALHPPPATPAVIVQKTPAGALVTVPDPVPTAVTATIPVGGERYMTSATWFWATLI